MKKFMSIFMLLTLFSFACAAKIERDVDIDGARKGVWTMDYDAVLKKAKKEKVPIFINFTGSDWCVWCKLMDREIFSKEEWKKYAKKNLYLVWIDFPSDKSLVPEKYVERNRELSDTYGIRGYPTYLLFDYDGKTKLGKTGASRGKTPESFIKEIEKFMMKREDNLKKLTKSERKKYETLEDGLKKVKDELNEWLKTRPVKNDKNIKIYNGFLDRIKKQEDKIAKLLTKVKNRKKKEPVEKEKKKTY